ncbi:MAG: hypothetical protein WC733_09550, partial [Methylophilus sp.]
SISYAQEIIPVGNGTGEWPASGLEGTGAKRIVPIFNGGILMLDGTHINTYDFEIKTAGGAIDTHEIETIGPANTIAQPIRNYESPEKNPGALRIFSSVGRFGTLILNATNTYNGTTTIDGTAKLRLAKDDSIASSENVIVDGVLDIGDTVSSQGASIQTLNSTASTGKVMLNNQTLRLTKASSTFAGTIIGVGGLTLEDGTQALTGTNTYTGGTFLSKRSTLTLSGKGSIANTNIISGAGSLTFADGAQQTITGANAHIYAYTGETLIKDNSTLTLAGAGSIANSNSVSFEEKSKWSAGGGNLDISKTNSGASIKKLSGGSEYSRVVLGNQALQLTKTGGTFAGTIEGAGSLTLAQGAQQTLTGTNTYSGDTVIEKKATLKLSGRGSIANSNSVNLVAANSILDISGATNTVAIKALHGNGSVEFGAYGKTLNLTAANSDIGNNTGIFNGTFTGESNLIISGGTQVLANMNQSSINSTKVESGARLYFSPRKVGVLEVAPDSTFIAYTPSKPMFMSALAANTDSNNMHKMMTPPNALSIEKLIFDGAGSALIETGASNITIGSLIGNFTGLIDIDGGGSITGGGIEASGAVFYEGVANIPVGHKLIIADNMLELLEDSTIANGGYLDISGVDNLFVAALSDDLDGDIGEVYLGDKTLTITKAIGETFSGSISGENGNLVIQGGTEMLSGHTYTGVNTYTGNTTIHRNGVLALKIDGSIASSNSLIDNGIFDISGTTSGASIKSLSGNGAVYLGEKTLTITKAQDNFAGVISNLNGNVVIAGGQQTFSGANTYIGNTTIAQDATLLLVDQGAIANSVLIDNSGKLDLTNATKQVTFSGAYKQHQSGKLLMRTSPQASQHLNIAGKAALKGSLKLQAQDAAYTIGKYSLIKAGKIAGKFAKLTSDFAKATKLDSYLTYDKKHVYLNLAPNATTTLNSMKRSTAGLSTVINLQTAALQTGLAYDCSQFDQHGLCISAVGRSTYAGSKHSGQEQAGALIIGYKPHDTF